MNQGVKDNASKHSIGLLILILLISSLGQVTSDLYLPSLPYMAKNLDINIHSVQFTVAIYMTGFSLSQLVYGPWSDAVGRRIPLLVGLSINFWGSLLCFFSPNINVLLLGRLLQGLGVGAGTALVRPILRDLFEKETLAVYNSYVSISGVVILSIAPTLGGYIQYYAGWRYNFMFLSVFGFLILFFYYMKAPETNPYFEAGNFRLKTILGHAKILMQNPIFLKFSLCPLLTYAGIIAWLTVAPILLQEKMGFSSVQFGWLCIFSGIGFAIGAYTNLKLVTQFGMETMIKLGLICQLSAGIVMLFFYQLGLMNAAIIFAPILLFMLGSSLVFPNASAGALTPFPKIAGIGGALFGFMQIIGGAISSSVVALAHDESVRTIAVAFIIVSVLSIFTLHLFKIKPPYH